MNKEKVSHFQKKSWYPLIVVYFLLGLAIGILATQIFYSFILNDCVQDVRELRELVSWWNYTYTLI